jgi:hypothetical protein
MPEIHTKRQATKHGCLPSLLGEGDKGIEIVHGEEKNILYWAGAAKAEQKSLVPARQAPRTNQERNPFHLFSLSPHSPKFQQSAGDTPFWSPWLTHSTVKLARQLYL